MTTNSNEKFYDLSIQVWEDTYSRLISSEIWDINIDNLREWIMKDVFYKIEAWDEEKANTAIITYKEISKKVFEELENNSSYIFLILDEKNNSISRR